MSKRNDIIKYLLDLGLDVNTQNDELRVYHDDELLFRIGEWEKYCICAPERLFDEYFGDKASEVFMKMAEYSCIDVEDRRK